jgi:cleavage stimulation factor subunit 2
MSAVRNLNNVDVGGRPLRIDLADSDPFLEGKTTVRGEIIDGGETRAQWRERERERERDERDKSNGSFSSAFGAPRPDSQASLTSLPPGIPVPPGSNALDMISQNLATIPPAQLMEVLAQMKVRQGLKIV